MNRDDLEASVRAIERLQAAGKLPWLYEFQARALAQAVIGTIKERAAAAEQGSSHLCDCQVYCTQQIERKCVGLLARGVHAQPVAATVPFSPVAVTVQWAAPPPVPGAQTIAGDLRHGAATMTETADYYRGYHAGLERAAKYHDGQASDCRAIAAVNRDNDLGPDCETNAIDHEVAADEIRAISGATKPRIPADVGGSSK